jgi:choline dehydrogenase-like flavoprotein
VIRDLIVHPDRQTIEADVLVVGAGTVGLVIATRLAEKGLKVVALESGDRQQKEEEHPLNEVVQLRSIYSGAAYRFRCLGGTSTRWGGALIPFVPVDVNRELWPVSHKEICAYWREVEIHFGLSCGSYECAELSAQMGQKDADYVARLAKWPRFVKRNVANLLSSALERMDGPEIWLNATATRFQIGTDGRLQEVIAEAPNKSYLTVRAQEFIIAAGAIESTRLLLLADRQNGDKFFAPYDQLGRYLYDHLAVAVANIQVRDRKAFNRIAGFRFEKGGCLRNLRFELSDSTPCRNAIPACFVHISFQDKDGSGFDALRGFLRQLQQRRGPKFSTLLKLAHSLPWLSRALWWRFYEQRLLYPTDADIQLQLVIEQRPRPENRIFLSGDRYDSLGQPLAVIDWSVDKEDERNLTKATDVFLEAWEKSTFSKLGTIRRRLPGEAEAELASGGGVYHPGGTIRMGTTPAAGVVNGDLSAFHVPNMHVISTATFPTGGGANPTMMLLMFAFRLVDGIAKKFQKVML